MFSRGEATPVLLITPPPAGPAIRTTQYCTTDWFVRKRKVKYFILYTFLKQVRKSVTPPQSKNHLKVFLWSNNSESEVYMARIEDVHRPQYIDDAVLLKTFIIWARILTNSASSFCVGKKSPKTTLARVRE